MCNVTIFFIRKMEKRPEKVVNITFSAENGRKNPTCDNLHNAKIKNHNIYGFTLDLGNKMWYSYFTFGIKLARSQFTIAKFVYEERAQ